MAVAAAWVRRRTRRLRAAGPPPPRQARPSCAAPRHHRRARARSGSRRPCTRGEGGRWRRGHMSTRGTWGSCDPSTSCRPARRAALPRRAHGTSQRRLAEPRPGLPTCHPRGARRRDRRRPRGGHVRMRHVHQHTQARAPSTRTRPAARSGPARHCTRGARGRSQRDRRRPRLSGGREGARRRERGAGCSTGVHRSATRPYRRRKPCSTARRASRE
mmetsp:Transcript_7029/g.18006  ORF Transcript_7029/g.18006 Transcript_7029/m.18006 type:complete len:216 (+) Transcript_7029:828-1475(+)